MKEKISLQEQLKLELERFNSINSYTKKLMVEQAPAQNEPTGDDELPPIDDPAAAPPEGEDAGGLEGLDNLGGDEAAPEGETPDDGVSDELASDTGADDETEEIDITDLVNMTKNIKQSLENRDDGSGEVMMKMQGVFQQLQDLQNRLGEMDKIFTKIDELSGKVEQMRPPTPQEKLEMRSIDSGPFKEKPQDFFNTKKAEMERSGKNEYVLTPDDVKTYSKNEIMKSFNPDIENY